MKLTFYKVDKKDYGETPRAIHKEKDRETLESRLMYL